MTDDLGDRMKFYESFNSSHKSDPSAFVYARIDGRAFSTLTSRCEKPFDPAFTAAMLETTVEIVRQTKPKIGYVQSDEMSFFWEPGKVFFDGKIQKMVSVLAGLASAVFTTKVGKLAEKYPHFDCRIVELPSKDEVANVFYWRVLDARRNAVLSLSEQYFSSKFLHGKSVTERLQLLYENGVDFEKDFPDCYKHGSFFRRKNVTKEFSQEELATIPEHQRPTGPVIRTEVQNIQVPYLGILSHEQRVSLIMDGTYSLTKE